MNESTTVVPTAVPPITGWRKAVLPAFVACVRASLRVSPRPMVYTNQHQRRIERHRSESVGRHALHLALVVHRYDGHSGRKASQSLAEFC